LAQNQIVYHQEQFDRIFVVAKGRVPLATNKKGARMSILPKSDHQERIGERYVKNKEVSMHMLNKRAERKLDYVVKAFADVMGDRHIETTHASLSYSLLCNGFKHLKNLTLDYIGYENRLWAFAYNLNLKSTLDASQYKNPETEDCKFVVQSKGKIRVSSPQWVDSGSRCSEEKVDAYLKRLSHKLIMDRITALDMMKIQVSYNAKAQQWTVKYQSIIGSTNWILIPPVLQLIKYTPEEMVRTLEFFELVLDSVTDPEKNISQPKKK
jgi:hypothetical protein